MNSSAPLPEDLLRFLDANVDSVEQLELLRIVGESPGRQWRLQELASKAQARPAAIRSLEQRELLRSQTIGSEVRWGSAELTTETEETLHRLLQLYKERPVTLIRMVHARARKL